MMLGENHYHVIVCHHDEGRNLQVLTLIDNNLDVITWYGYLSRESNVLCAEVARQIGISFDLVFLQAECENGPMFSPALLIFEVSSDEIPEAPYNHKWVPQANADELNVHPPTEPVIRYLEQFKRVGFDVNVERLFPYNRGGWFQAASKWFRTALAENGHQIEAIRQFRNGIECSMLVGESGSGALFYMKAMPPRTFNNEVNVSWLLARAMPETFPNPLIVNNVKKWMVMRDYGAAISMEECSMETQPDLVRTMLCSWARVQKKSISMVGELSQSGIPVYDENRYKEKVKEMLNHSDYIDAQLDAMTEEEKQLYGKEQYKQELQAYVERLLLRLSNYKVPLTLVHGDLNATNVFRNEDGSFSFCDHAYTSIPFPFLDAIWFLWTCMGKDESLDFYLSFWTEFETLERLRELVLLVKDLRRIHLNIMSLHFYLKTQEGRRGAERINLADPLCSMFKKYQ